MVSGKTTKGQKVGLVLDLVVVGWVFFALSSVYAVSKTCGRKQGNKQPPRHSSCVCRYCVETAVRWGGRYYCLGKCLWLEVRE